MMQSWLKCLTSFALVSVLAACSVNPVTGRQDLVLMGEGRELALGEQQYPSAQQQQGGQYTIDAGLNDYINRVGQRLARVSDRPDLPYEFVVLNNAVPNAWALPGGKIAINRGLLLELQDEAQLAAVLSHEIVHAAARHSAQQMAQQTLIGIGVMAVGVAAAANDERYAGLVVLGAGIGAQAWMARYSRQNELESDHYGMKYMAQAGYDPMAAVELQEIFVKLSADRKSSFIDGLFASHPPSQERVAANRQMASSLPGGERGKASYEKAIKQLRADAAAYKLQKDAEKAFQEKDKAQSLKLIQQAIVKQPREAQFYLLRGTIEEDNGNLAEAQKSFDTAVAKQPSYYATWLSRGLVNKKRGEVENAKRDLARSRDLLDTQVASFHLGEIAMQQGDKSSARSYFSAVAAAGGELGKAAQGYLQQLQEQ